MLFYNKLYVYLLGAATTLSATVPTWEALALAEEKVKEIASQTTVVIAQGLQKGDIEVQEEFNPGSGVIVARSGQTYYVLTVLHVVRTRDVVYGIRTTDGEVHLVDDVTTHANIHPFGTESQDSGTTISRLDLAIIKFESDRTYPVAPIGDSASLKSGDKIFVSGWPEPEVKNTQRKHYLSEGILTGIISPPSADGEYSLLYNNLTGRGMSGGPIFNVSGELIGIHGRGRGRENNCSSSEVNINNSCGIQILHFLNQAIAVRLNFTFHHSPVKP